MKKSMIAAMSVLLLTASCGDAEAEEGLVPRLERLAGRGDAEAIYHLGMAYQTGTDLPKDPAKAVDAFRRAAELGDPLAAYKLGCYYDGQGEGLVEKSEDMALRHKLVAAKAGYALAQQDVAALYAQRGDMPAAYAWLRKSAAQGWPGGLMNFAAIHNLASGAVRDPAMTAAHFRLYLDRVEGSDQQRQWLRDFESRMSPEQKRRAAAIQRDYRARPTELTLKALSGRKAAEALAARSG